MGTGRVGVLEGRELVLTLHLEAGELRELEPLEVVKDELLELDAVGLSDVGDGLGLVRKTRRSRLGGEGRRR